MSILDYNHELRVRISLLTFNGEVVLYVTNQEICELHIEHQLKEKIEEKNKKEWIHNMIIRLPQDPDTGLGGTGRRAKR